MPPRPLTFFGLRLWPVAGTIAAVAIAVAGLTWLERSNQPSTIQPSTIQPPPPPVAESPAAAPAAPAATPLASAPPAQSAPANPAAETPNPLPSGTGAATYWVDDRNNRVAFSRQAIALPRTATDPEAQLRQAMESLLSGNGQTSSIPKGTRLRSLKIQRRNIYVDLSQEFVGGGGTASMAARVGQVLLTVTSLDPTAPVWLLVEGEALRELGGEGIEVPQPLTKASFEQNFGL